MTMSTQTLDEAARQLTAAVLIDSVQILDVGEPVTTGFNVARALTEVGAPVPGLVQQTSLATVVDGRATATYSVKVSKRTALTAGQAVRVESCLAEPDLVGTVLLVDEVSHNGLAMIRKAVASTFNPVNQEGKGTL